MGRRSRPAGGRALLTVGDARPSFAALIRAVADFPKPGVLFRDVTPLLADAQGFADCVAALAAPWRDAGVQAVCGIEARGFIFGAVLARALGAGFVPLRKPGKLPPPVLAVDYQLEYGSDRLEARSDAIAPGTRVLLVDDVLATGGTLAAAQALVAHFGGDVVGASVLIELEALRGRERWMGEQPLHALLRY
ncbi:adenine phosphoribosyltransferase [Rhodanobacter hydrolyticus]|uniref:Adenine phosphoribosyltransferase n=1 Tax=Rhodanobacter hydrolyticus TaxID=2250595 RepID=A0ABW8J8E9_9GAMM